MKPYFRGLHRFIKYKQRMLHSMSSYCIPRPTHFHYVYPQYILSKVHLRDFQIETSEIYSEVEKSRFRPFLANGDEAVHGLSSGAEPYIGLRES